MQIELYRGDQMNQLTFDRNGFYLDGRPFRIISRPPHSRIPALSCHERRPGDRALADMFREGGVDVPLYTTDGNTFSMFVFGREDMANFFGVNFRAKPGFNLGRYDSAGPQLTLYLPGHFLKEKDNELIMLDLDPVGEKTTVDCLDHEILEGEAEELR